MPGVQTYTLIQEQTLSSSAASVSFSSIPQIYEDLILEVVASGQSGSNGSAADIKFNSSSSDYSLTQIYGDGSSAVSSRSSNQTSLNSFNFNASTPSIGVAQIMSYSNTNVFKTVLIRSDSSAAYTIARVGLWRNTSAITSISIDMNSPLTFNSGTTFRLYGIVG